MRRRQSSLRYPYARPCIDRQMSTLSNSVAVKRYLERYIEPDLPPAPPDATWRHVVVIPAYREPAKFLDALGEYPQGAGKILLVVVLNRPDNDPDPTANTPLRSALTALPPAGDFGAPLYALSSHSELYLLDLEKRRGPTPAAEGVGRARKAGCDLALKWIHKGNITDRWIYCTDADAGLPRDYFRRLDNCKAPAAVFPFKHIAGEDPDCNEATALYETRLHHYVRGLQQAGSPYAFHTLGSCLAVQAEAYTQVRGFPKRAGAEDFYLLNKLAKIAPVESLQGNPVTLSSRRSDRVPFGTGPAVAAIMDDGALEQQRLFYAPQVFNTLRALLNCVPELQVGNPRDLEQLLSEHGLSSTEARQVSEITRTMGFEKAIGHCRRQGGKDAVQFLRHFHQWFDGFRTLKFIHTLTNSLWPKVSLRELP